MSETLSGVCKFKLELLYQKIPIINSLPTAPHKNYYYSNNYFKNQNKIVKGKFPENFSNGSTKLLIFREN